MSAAKAIPLRGGRVTKDPRLDRVPQFDQRSRNFPIRQLIPPLYKPRGYTWSIGAQLDQGSEGACTGFAVTHDAVARPVVVTDVSDDLARKVYYRARQLDEWPGEDYSGSSVLAAVKAGQELGWYPEYRWGFGLDDSVLALGYKGPGIAGLNWYGDMLRTDADGFIHPSGGIVGGHAILVRAVNVRRRFVTLRNSWGPDWGVNGDCRLTFADFDRLLHEQGEFCIPVKRSKPKVAA